MASALYANNMPGYFYRHPTGSPELDFVISIQGEPTIIECKSSRTSAISMRFVLDHKKRFGSHPAIKPAETNVGKGDGFRTLPLYALGFIFSQMESLKAPLIDLSNL